MTILVLTTYYAITNPTPMHPIGSRPVVHSFEAPAGFIKRNGCTLTLADSLRLAIRSKYLDLEKAVAVECGLIESDDIEDGSVIGDVEWTGSKLIYGDKTYQVTNHD